ncbi:glycosyltransferase involved in cell wall biosynthesis [Altererythrobacter atlanticus]|uniref:GDP-mannose-dependent alpha-mannosyltransferase n=1 Tax=Croceibacterium atlanticum TaxID=1267766 RepID=A0A0F7KW01_9SPHN|nr:glycosyltransferase family 1 protein [Croceibacterium atlanticum]AKH43366.1 GDP-mannose-dependent alpha-mannosyltransferase [Croceibacterium atlanticum]MBB5731927.1 glycosyltransferase involved in cell wall biosynthesis [Croceibacterium atlanticum]
MKIAIVTDAWAPQVNGVVRTLGEVTAELRRRGHELLVISPELYRSVPCPTYPEIRLALAGRHSVGARIDAFAPRAVHIATEGPLGLAARRHCLSSGLGFTTAYHTQFPQYLARRTGMPASLFWPYIRWFHGPSAGIMVATETVRRELRRQRLSHLRHWSRGVDLACFSPDIAPPDMFFNLPRPIQLYVGRVAPEKNIEAFLSNTHRGSRVVVGDGPDLARLKAEFPDAHFLGRQSGRALAACYAGADIFVFPSMTDTFGLVMIEALACGTPVAAYPVPGPLDVLNARSGAMAARLEDAIARALTLKREDCLAHGRSFSWQASVDQFLAALEPGETGGVAHSHGPVAGIA